MEFEPEVHQRDRELTLGPIVLTMLGLGLLALCAICFISGYAMGRHATADAGKTVAENDGPSAAQLFNQQPKPPATQASLQPKDDATAEGAPAASDGATPAEPGAEAGKAAVVPASMPAQGTPAPAGNQQVVHAVLPQTGGTQWMVQVALTPNQKDAELMAGDLRGKGVNVSLRRDAASSLIYVQAGPFATHEEAAAMRQKIVAAGYNGIIQP